jgi:hypothetical protein
VWQTAKVTWTKQVYVQCTIKLNRSTNYSNAYIYYIYAAAAAAYKMDHKEVVAEMVMFPWMESL